MVTVTIEVSSVRGDFEIKETTGGRWHDQDEDQLTACVERAQAKALAVMGVTRSRNAQPE